MDDGCEVAANLDGMSPLPVILPVARTFTTNCPMRLARDRKLATLMRGPKQRASEFDWGNDTTIGRSYFDHSSSF